VCFFIENLGKGFTVNAPRYTFIHYIFHSGSTRSNVKRKAKQLTKLHEYEAEKGKSKGIQKVGAF
jgi:hypothetical protein